MVVDSAANPGGPRLLTQRNLEKLVMKVNGIDIPRPAVEPGNMQLFSYYKPGLMAGNYFISAEQFIKAKHPRFKETGGEQTLRVCNWKGKLRTPPATEAPAPQQFEVMTPQFTLEEKLVNSFYPPEGHQDEGRVLPHIVIADPHFPWERDAGHSFDGSRKGPLAGARERDPDLNAKGETIDMSGKVTTDRNKMVYRSMVPWVKLMVFDSEELKLSSQQEAHDLGIPQYQNLATAPQIDTQSANCAFKMTSGQYLTSLKSGQRVNFDKAYANDAAGLAEIKTGRRSNEPCQVIFPKKDLVYKAFNDIESNKYLAHVRNVNTIGFPNAGLEEDGLFSIVISGRTGAFKISEPKTQICHLVSIEHMDATFAEDFKNWNVATAAQKEQRFGMLSLYSWTYTALPPDPMNFIDAMKMIVGDETRSFPGNMQMLRPLDSVITSLTSVKDGPAKALGERLRNGYTIARWRAETGEESAAFNRGPLVPMPTPSIPCKDWINNVKSREEIVKKLSTTVTGMASMTKDNVSEPHRIVEPSNTLAPPVQSPEVAPVLEAQIQSAVKDASSAGDEIWNEFNTSSPNNTDWKVIHQFITDKLYLGDIPAHVLFPDPSTIPLESIRFFYIDDAWMDCLIDGALSVGNHLEKDDDKIKSSIKDFYNRYLQTVVPETTIKPQIPVYGFILRSQLVKCMPDLKITVNWNTDSSDKRAPVCQWLRPDDVTLVALLDRFPEELLGLNNDSPDKGGICLSQPQHQQRFSFGYGFKDQSNPLTSEFEFRIRELYTSGAPRSGVEWPQLKHSTIDPTGCIDMTTRILNTTTLAKKVHDCIFKLETNVEHPERKYEDYVANSAELGLELNDPAYYFSVYPAHTSTNKTPRVRKLWTKAVQDGTDGTIGVKTDIPTFSKKSPPSQPPDPDDDDSKPGPVQPVPPDPPNKPPRIITKILPTVPAPVGRQDAVAQVQNFSLKIWVDYKGPQPFPEQGRFYKLTDYVPTENDYLLDLIFSVRRSQIRQDNNIQRLREIIINIPSTNSDKSDALVRPDWSGSVNMLANQRFTPFVNRAATFLQVRLVPRSAQKAPVMAMNDNRTSEVSFRLTDVEVPKSVLKAAFDFKTKKDGKDIFSRETCGFAKVDMFERYETGGDGTSTVWNKGTTVIKRDGPDPGR